jgi:hypothetical protein
MADTTERSAEAIDQGKFEQVRNLRVRLDYERTRLELSLKLVDQVDGLLRQDWPADHPLVKAAMAALRGTHG